VTYSTDSVHVSRHQLRASSTPQMLPPIQAKRLRFFGHVARMGDSQKMFRAPNTSIRELRKDCRGRLGRPTHTWLRTLCNYDILKKSNNFKSLPLCTFTHCSSYTTISSENECVEFCICPTQFDSVTSLQTVLSIFITLFHHCVQQHLHQYCWRHYRTDAVTNNLISRSMK